MRGFGRDGRTLTSGIVIVPARATSSGLFCVVSYDHTSCSPVACTNRTNCTFQGCDDEIPRMISSGMRMVTV